MAFSRENQELITSEIDSRIEKALRNIAPPSGFRRALYFLREWGILAANVALIIALLTAAFTQFYAANTRLATEATFRAHTEDRLDAIERILLEMQAASAPKKVLNQISNLNGKQFAANLPALKEVVIQPPVKVASDYESLQRVAERLAKTDDKTPDYWPTTLLFANFATASANAEQISVAVTHVKEIYGSDSPSGGFGNSFDHQTLILDGGTLRGLTITGSKIVFTSEPVRLVNVRFINCVFEFPETPHPTPYLMKATLDILKSDLKSVFIGSLG